MFLKLLNVNIDYPHLASLLLFVIGFKLYPFQSITFLLILLAKYLFFINRLNGFSRFDYFLTKPFRLQHLNLLSPSQYPGQKLMGIGNI